MRLAIFNVTISYFVKEYLSTGYTLTFWLSELLNKVLVGVLMLMNNELLEKSSEKLENLLIL